MEEKVKKIVNKEIENLNLIVDSVIYENVDNINYLRICLDRSEIIDLNKIVEATKIINPIMDKEDLIKDEYVLDIYGKSKGE